jgi:hypothetical protein
MEVGGVESGRTHAVLAHLGVPHALQPTARLNSHQHTYTPSWHGAL